MNLTGAGAALVGVLIGSTIYTLWNTIRFVKHRIDIKNDRENGNILAEGELQRDHASFFVMIVINVLVLIYMLGRRSFFFLHPVMKVSYGLFILGNILVILKLGMNVLQGDACYLSPRGLVCFDMSAEWQECRFTWEAPVKEGAIANTLYVYKEKSKVPIIVRFNYRYDEAHRVVERFAMGVRYTGYMEQEEYKQRPNGSDGKFNG